MEDSLLTTVRFQTADGRLCTLSMEFITSPGIGQAFFTRDTLNQLESDKNFCILMNANYRSLY